VHYPTLNEILVNNVDPRVSSSINISYLLLESVKNLSFVGDLSIQLCTALMDFIGNVPESSEPGITQFT